MDRDFLKNNMSAFLDGELEPKQMREFEHEIQSYPDLFVELQTLQRLNKLAMETQVPLPDDRYFDKLAEQIDAQIKREAPQERSRIVNFLLERRKTVAIISSVAAVFLIAVIGMNLYGPNAKRYPSELRNIELKPAIIEQPKTDTVTVWPEHEQQIVPPPVLESEVKRESMAKKVGKAALHEEADKLRSDSGATRLRNAPVPDTAPAVIADTMHKEIEVVTAERRLFAEPQTTKGAELLKVKPSEVKPSTLSGSIAPLPDLNTQDSERANIALPEPTKVDTITIRTQSIIPGLTDERYPMLKDSDVKSIEPDTAQFLGAGGLSWDVYIKAFRPLNQGIYPGWSLTALTISRDSLQAWVDSIRTIDPGLWSAEQAYRSLQRPNITWNEYQRWRACVDFYLADSPNADRNLWDQRVVKLNEILEHFLGKQNQHRD